MFISNKRRAFFTEHDSPRSRASNAAAMYSTPEESSVDLHALKHRVPSSSLPPTVQQIAMGLHTTRRVTSPSPRPPPPRSSMKKYSSSPPSSNQSTDSSIASSTKSGFFTRLFGLKKKTASSITTSSDSSLESRKAVRFSQDSRDS